MNRTQPRHAAATPPAARPITCQALAFFDRPEGISLLALAAGLETDSLHAQQRLRATYPADLCRAAQALIELRRRAVDKFPQQAASMFFDREALEMASRTEVAAHRAGRFADCDTVLDLCCGIGGDLLALGRHSRVVGVDLDRTRLEMARRNAAAAGLERVDLVQADALDVRLRADAVFVDPARRGQDGVRRSSHRAYTPPLDRLLAWRHRANGLAIKVSPAIDEAALPADGEVEFVSSGGQCREGVLYFGALARGQRRATVLPGGHSLERRPGAIAPVGPPGAFLYDPDAAVVRAHLIDELALQLDGWKLDPQIAYVTTDRACPTPFARGLRILTHFPFQLKGLRRYLRDNGLNPQRIKKRGFPLEPEQLRRRLGAFDGGQPVVLVTTRLGQKPVVLVCEIGDY